MVFNWRSYMARAFEFSRSFLFEWTVNWRFLREEVFHSRTLSATLLLGHLTVLGLALMCWTHPFGGVVRVVRRAVHHPSMPAMGRLTPSCMWLNEIGMSHKQLTQPTRHDWSFIHLQYHWHDLRKILTLSVLRLGSASACLPGVSRTQASGYKVSCRSDRKRFLA